MLSIIDKADRSVDDKLVVSRIVRSHGRFLLARRREECSCSPNTLLILFMFMTLRYAATFSSDVGVPGTRSWLQRHGRSSRVTLLLGNLKQAYARLAVKEHMSVPLPYVQY